jgi:hypothetical protein
MTCALYYWNFGRFITKDNKHTLVGRLRGGCQVFTILWFPVLCYWPSCIVYYIFLNGVFTVGQTTLTGTQWFIKRMNPKLVITQLMLRFSQWDEQQAEILIDTIRRGEESYLHADVDEDEWVEQVHTA